MSRLIDGFGDLRRVLGGTCAGPMIADIQIDQHVQFSMRRGRGVVIPGNLLEVVDDHHRCRFSGAAHLQRIGQRGSQEQSRNSGGGHQLGFRDRGHAHADRARGDLAPGDLHALVGFRVWPQRFARFLDARGHARQIRLELIQVQEKRRRG